MFSGIVKGCGRILATRATGGDRRLVIGTEGVDLGTIGEGDSIAHAYALDAVAAAVLARCRQVAKALEAAHGKEIIHRDLKPQNIMVSPEGEVKVFDAERIARQRGCEMDSSGAGPTRCATSRSPPRHQPALA